MELQKKASQYYQSYETFKKESEALQGRGEKLEYEARPENSDVALKSEQESFDMLKEETENILGYFKELQALKSAGDKLKAQKESLGSALLQGELGNTGTAQQTHEDLAAKTENGKFAAMEKETAHVMDWFQQLQ